MPQDELKRQREVDKMKLDRVEREHARRMEEVVFVIGFAVLVDGV